MARMIWPTRLSNPSCAEAFRDAHIETDLATKADLREFEIA